MPGASKCHAGSSWRPGGSGGGGGSDGSDGGGVGDGCGATASAGGSGGGGSPLRPVDSPSKLPTASANVTILSGAKPGSQRMPPVLRSVKAISLQSHPI